MYNNAVSMPHHQKIFFISLGLIFTATIAGAAFLYKQNNDIDQPKNWDIYEIDEKAVKHKITCGGSKNCYESYQDYGGNLDEIYIAAEKELNYYIPGGNIELQRTEIQ